MGETLYGILRVRAHHQRADVDSVASPTTRAGVNLFATSLFGKAALSRDSQP